MQSNKTKIELFNGFFYWNKEGKTLDDQKKEKDEKEDESAIQKQLKDKNRGKKVDKNTLTAPLLETQTEEIIEERKPISKENFVLKEMNIKVKSGSLLAIVGQ